MTFNELKALYESLINTDEISEDILCIWFNQAQNDLALDFGEVETQVINGTTAAMPTDLLRIIEVWDSEGNTYDNWQRLPTGYIRLGDGNGVHTLVYIAMPSVTFTVGGATTESLLPKPVHHLMSYYAAWKYWDEESEGDTEESNHATKFYNYYLQGKKTLASKLDCGSVGGGADHWSII